MDLHSFDPADVDVEIPAKHREIMLDLILAWGTLDGALGMMMATILQLPYDECAARFGDMPGSAKLREMEKLLRAHGNAEAAAILKKHKKSYERHSVPRNSIAHSHCGGVMRTNREYLVFAPFRRESAHNMLVEAIPLEQMQRATRWGMAMANLAKRVAGLP